MLTSTFPAKRLWLLVAVLFLIVFIGPIASAQDTVLITYQGRLTDDVGNPLTGNYDLTFGIYDASTGSSPLWGESHSAVAVSQGLFSVALGSESGLPDSLFTGHDRYLGITVGADPELSPRILFTSVPSAAYAKRVAGDVVTGDGTMLIKSATGDSAFVFNTGLTPSFTMYLMEPLDKQPLIEMKTNSDIGGRISIYDMEPLDKNEVIAIGGSPLGHGSIKMFNPQPEPPARLMEMNVAQDDLLMEWGSRLSMHLMEPLDKKILEMSAFPSTGASFKMFNPQPEPPAVLFELNADAGSGASMAFHNDFGALMTAEPNPSGGFVIRMEDPEEEPAQMHVELGSSFGLKRATSMASDGGFLSLYSPTDYLQTHLEAGALTMYHEADAIVGPPVYLTAANTYARIGIGTLTPSEPLVIGTDLGSFGGHRVVIGDNSAGEEPGFVVGADSDNRGWLLWNVDDRSLGMGTRENGTTYGSSMVLRTGRVGIGNTSPSEPLSIGTDLGSYYGEFVQIGNTTAGRYTGFMCGENLNNRGVVLWYNNSNQLRLGSASEGVDYNATLVIHEDQVAINTITPGTQELYVVGDIYATGEILAFSDVAGKTNVEQIDHALDIVDQLRGVRYNLHADLAREFKASEDTQIGLIAQEVEGVLPEVVNSPKEGYKSIDYSRMTAVLVEAIKELKSENEQLRARLDRLEGR